jgi:hypothetical protein
VNLASSAVYRGSRKQLQKSEFKFETPPESVQELAGYDANGNPIYYDLKARIVNLGQGKYEFRWLDPKGRHRRSMFQRPDAIDVIVEAETYSTSAKTIKYRYTLERIT